MEIWTYNFGSSRLLRHLRFIGDELVDIRTERATDIDVRRPVLWLVVVALGGLTDARADGMRCGSRLIGDEDSIDKVIELCGEPSDRSRTWIVRRPRYELMATSTRSRAKKTCRSTC